MKYQEYIIQCDRCRNKIVNKIEVNDKESIYSKIGLKVIGYCIQCGQKEYHTVIEPYFEMEDLDD